MYNLGHIFLLIIALSCHSFAQPDSLYEIITENSDDDASLIEVLEYLLTHPIDINRTTRAELEAFPFLNSNQIDLILNNRPYSGKRDLRVKIGNDLYQLIRPYCTAKKAAKRIKFDLAQRTQYTLEKNVGLQSGKYLGSPYEVYTKFRFEYNNNFKTGILFQKDVGERELYDHVSGFVQWQDSRSRLKLILGNFKIHVGQGLVLSSPYSINKSASADAVLKWRTANGSFYLSSNENAGFEGIFAGYNVQDNISLGGFYSQKSKDARIDEQNQQIIGLEYDGYHRTLSELRGKNVIKENSCGGFMDISIYNKTNVGISAVRTRYKPSIRPLNNSQINRQDFFQFNGNYISAYSFFYTAYLSGVFVFGEAAANRWMGISNQHGFLITTSKWKAGLKWWRLPVDYQTPFGRIFSNNISFPRGEQGLYLSLEGQLYDVLDFSSYWYSEKKLWRTYFNPLPTQSRECYVRLIWTFDYKTQILCHYYSSHIHSYPIAQYSTIRETKQRVRLQIEKKVLKNIRLRSRIDKVIIEYSLVLSKIQGINMYQDLFWRLTPEIAFSIRFSCFDTANYDSRIYEYENDLPGMFSTYPLYGKGIKWYILCSCKLWEKIQLWIKYRNIHIDGIEAIGSGYSQINGDTRKDVKFQMQIKY